MAMTAVPEAGKKPYLLIDYVEKPKSRILEALSSLFARYTEHVYLQLGIEEHNPGEKFRIFAQSKTPPSSNHPRIFLKTKTETFNHAQEFVIHNGLIWYRKRDVAGSAWTAVYFDGFEEGRLPKEIKADGANLMVLDDRDEIHYKKVLWECTKENLEGTDQKWEDANRAWNTAKQTFQIDSATTPSYIAVDLVHLNNWKKTWFSLPGVAWVTSFMGYGRLKLPGDRRGWTVSHRGSYFNYFQDGGGIKRYSEGGTTTLDVLHSSGTKRERKDPWTPPFADMSFPLPATSKTIFETVESSSSASNIMLIGYECNAANPGQTKKTLKILTQLSDIDIDGWNPLKGYTYSLNDRDKSRWVVSLEGWKEHPLILAEGEEITSIITIEQIGEGNNAFELRVAGKNQEGFVGFFYKKIDGSAWNFYPYPIALTASLPLEEVANAPFSPPLKDYKATAKLLHFDVALKNFGDHTLTSEMVLSSGNESYRLLVHKTKSLKHFLGAKDFDYLLIIPDAYRSIPAIQVIFNSTWLHPLSVYLTPNEVAIQATALNLKFIQEP